MKFERCLSLGLSLCILSALKAAPALASGDPSFTPAAYQSQLTSLSQSALDAEYAKKLTSWTATCVPDALKVGLSAVLETVPGVSMINDAVGMLGHLAWRENPGYMATFNRDGKNGTTHDRMVTTMLLGGLYGSLTDNPGAYSMTRILAHDSFDADANSACSQSALEISEIRTEMTRRGQNISQPGSQQSSAAQKSLLNPNSSSAQSPVGSAAGQGL
jgi:hypothetical protein